MSLIQILLIAVIVLIFVVGAALFLMNQEAARTRRAMRVIQGRSVSGGTGGGGGLNDKGAQDRRRAEIAKKLKDAKEEEESGKAKKKKSVAMMIAQAGLGMSVKQFWLLSVFVMVLLTVFAKLVGQPPHILIMAAVIGLLGLPRFVLKKMAAKRQKEFLQEFPDALEATVRLLKAGMPVGEAVLMISKEFEGPVGEEMSRIYDKQKIGIALHEAALEATYRMPLPEMQMFATGLAIQAQTGSSLSEVLMNLSNVIRARFRLKRKIKALSSEAIASAGIIAALPILVATGMYFANYEYISILFTDSFGKVLLTGAVVWMSIGIFVMRTMINFKI